MCGRIKPMLEKKIEGSVVDYAKRKGMYVRKFTSPQRRGAPDRLFAFKGRIFWIEFKSEKGVLSKLQAAEHREMRKHGLTVYVCNSVTQGRKIIDGELDADTL